MLRFKHEVLCNSLVNLDNKTKQLRGDTLETILSFVIDFGGNGLIASTMVASHAGVLRGARFSSFPTNACSTENNTPFPLCVVSKT